MSTAANIADNYLPFSLIAILIPEWDMNLMIRNARLDPSDPNAIYELPAEYSNVSVITPDMQIDEIASIGTCQHASVPRDRAFCVYVPSRWRDACGMPTYTTPSAMLESMRHDIGLLSSESHATEHDIVQLTTRLDIR